MENIVNTLVGYIWGNALVALALGVGLYFTIITKGVQFRYFKEMLTLLRERQTSKDGISPFQAFCMALAGRVGIGAIAGVATAIAAGGPGAIFWMMVMGLLGGASAFAESTLAQFYKQRSDGQYRGGSPYYIEKGLKLKSFAIFVAVVICLSYGVLVPGIQANTITEAFQLSFNLPPIYTAVIVTLLMAFLIFGGVKRIASAADKIVPLMALLYILMTVIILLVNYDRVPKMFMLIINSAMGTDAIFGAIVGQSVSWGVRRAVFSTVAGAGEATFSSAAAETSHPVKQGLIQAFSIYCTIIVCVSSGLAMLVTDTYNVYAADKALVEHIPSVTAGSTWMQISVSSVFSSLGSGFVAMAVFLFAFTTLMAYYYISETTIVYLDSKLRYPILKLILKFVFLGVVFFGCIQSVSLMWGIGDIGFGSMSYLNFITIVLLSKPLLKTLKNYDEQYKAGKDPVFDPEKAKIPDVEIWNEIKKTYRK